MVIDTSGAFVTATDNILVKIATVLYLRSFTHSHSHLEWASESAAFFDQQTDKRRYT